MTNTDLVCSYSEMFFFKCVIKIKLYAIAIIFVLTHEV